MYPEEIRRRIQDEDLDIVKGNVLRKLWRERERESKGVEEQERGDWEMDKDVG